MYAAPQLPKASLLGYVFVALNVIRHQKLDDAYEITVAETENDLSSDCHLNDSSALSVVLYSTQGTARGSIREKICHF